MVYHSKRKVLKNLSKTGGDKIYMKKKKHIPPSRKRYEKKYPSWSVRMPQEWIEDMEKYLRDTRQSRRDFMGISLEKQKADCTKEREEGFEEGKELGKEIGKEEGYKNAEKKYRIWYYCRKCNDIIIMMPNGLDHKALIEYMKLYGWSHTGCLNK